MFLSLFVLLFVTSLRRLFAFCTVFATCHCHLVKQALTPRSLDERPRCSRTLGVCASSPPYKMLLHQRQCLSNFARHLTTLK
ncbi:hypothetical protein EDB83DRAFT_2329245 [Lactarius deliciosus]|nr:hypothetical protein EDB83DRAFT_2329245 [Lactarius deliciosus]